MKEVYINAIKSEMKSLIDTFPPNFEYKMKAMEMMLQMVERGFEDELRRYDNDKEKAWNGIVVWNNILKPIDMYIARFYHVGKTDYTEKTEE